MTKAVDLKAIAKAVGFSEDPTDDEVVEFKEALRLEVFGDDVVVLSASEKVELDKVAIENEKLRSANEDYSASLKAMGEKVERMEVSEADRRFGDIATGYDPATKKRDPEAGFIGDHAKKISFMRKLEKTFGEDSDELKDYIVEQREIAKATVNSSDFKEIGGSGEETAPVGSPWAAINAKAQALVEAGEVKSLSEGIDRVVETDEKLANAYTNSMRQ